MAARPVPTTGEDDMAGMEIEPIAQEGETTALAIAIAFALRKIIDLQKVDETELETWQAELNGLVALATAGSGQSAADRDAFIGGGKATIDLIFDKIRLLPLLTRS
jgi:hypothetical protein